MKPPRQGPAGRTPDALCQGQFLARAGSSRRCRRCRPGPVRWSLEVAGRRHCPARLDVRRPGRGGSRRRRRDALRPLPRRAVRAGHLGERRKIGPRTSCGPGRPGSLLGGPWQAHRQEPADVRITATMVAVLHRAGQLGQDPSPQECAASRPIFRRTARRRKIAFPTLRTPAWCRRPGRRDRPGVRAGHRRAGWPRTPFLPAPPPRAGRDRAGRQARPGPGSRARLRESTIAAGDPSYRTVKGIPGRRPPRRDHAAWPVPRPGTAAPSRVPARAPASFREP